MVWVLLILITNIVYTQDTNISISKTNTSFLKNMEDEITKKEFQWKFNPFRTSRAEKRLIGWQDPYANITRFFIGDLLNANHMFPDPNYFIDRVTLFYTPTIATEFSVVAFNINRLKFRMGVGVFIDINMGLYSKHLPRFGQNFIFSDYIQVEVYLDFIVDDTWKFRWIPLRHKCDHLSGDILGDPALHDPHTSPFGDTGTEETVLQAFYNYGWFTFYGGIGTTLRGSELSTFANVFNIHFGTDVRVPVWGKINFIMGFYVAGEYDRFNTLKKDLSADNLSGKLYSTHTEYQWNPLISIGMGFEIDRFTIGAKYFRRRSRQIHAHRVIDERIGAEFTILY